MLSISGLASGIDTTAVINGLLEIQQAQIDRQNTRRADVLLEQTAFSGFESRLLSLRNSLSQLANFANSAVNDKLAISSNESILTAAASDKATAGVYRLKVEQLATAHQVATGGFQSEESLITTGKFEIQVGSSPAQEVVIGSENNTLRGLADAINTSGADVTASIINNGDADAPFQLIVTSNKTGEANQFFITNTLGETTGDATKPEFNFGTPVDSGKDAVIVFGTGDDDGNGAIRVQSADNRVEDLITGVTINLASADADEEVTLSVTQDVETARTAIQDFTQAYNDLIQYVNEQTSFNSTTLQGGALLGERSVSFIKDEIQQTLTGVIGGANSQLNRLAALGITFNGNGTLSVNSTQLEEALTGQIEGISAADVAKLFALSGESDNSGISFVLAGSDTVEGEVQVEITDAAEQATIVGLGTAPGASTTIDADNDTLSIKINGKAAEVKLGHGDYTVDELATELERAINASDDFQGRDVSVAVDGGALRITTESYGSSSEISDITGTAAAALGFSGDEFDIGQDVVGKFIYDGVEESAIGSGQLLSGRAENEYTADLQVRVGLTSSQLGQGAEATVNITRGFASRLSAQLDTVLEEDGRVSIVNERYTGVLDSIQQSIDRLNARFEAEQESLIRQFTQLETIVAELQSTGGYLTALL